MEITIGSDHSNDIVLEHPSISRKHARITVKEDKYYILEDLNSKNGIIVNGRRIRKKRLDHEDDIRIGKYIVVNDKFFHQIKEIHYKEKKDFTEEYQKIFQKMESYQAAKDKIMKTPVLPIVLRIGLGAIVILILFFFPGTIPDNKVRYGLIMLAALSSSAATFWISRGNKKRDKLDRLKLQYEDVLVCPKCHSSLVNYNLVYLIGRGRCPNNRCDAVYHVLNKN